jgi:hypothetical protein
MVAVAVAIGETNHANAYAKDKACKSGNQIELTLVGPKEITVSQKPTRYSLKAESCNTTIPKHLKNVTLEELGPGTEKHKWHIKRFPVKTTKNEKFNVTFPAENNGSPSSETIVMEAFSKGKRIGFNKDVLKYATSSGSTGSTGATGSTSFTGATGPNGEALPPGIYIDGPTTVSIRTPQPYDYTVEVVPDKTVKDANVLISVPENSTGVRKVINLTYGHPWLYDLKVTFESTAGMTSEGIAAGFFSPATKTEPVASFHDDFLLTPAITSN